MDQTLGPGGRPTNPCLGPRPLALCPLPPVALLPLALCSCRRPTGRGPTGQGPTGSAGEPMTHAGPTAPELLQP